MIGSLVVETVVVASVASVCVVAIVDVVAVVAAVVISVRSVFVDATVSPHETRKTVVNTTIKHIILFNATPPQTE